MTRGQLAIERQRQRAKAAIGDEVRVEIRARAMEEAARICEGMIERFLSPNYSSDQPLGSFRERFACCKCAEAIREAAGLENPNG